MQAAFPVRLEGRLDPQLSRWLWLVKWLLALPHVVVLVFLWLTFFALSVAAFFAILFTGRYPRSVFDFNVGVLRWTWRVLFYAYGALGTDRYPPFTLAEAPDYPATLEIAYPERLSRRLVLVKWWLLAIPHYLIVGIFAGGAWVAWQADSWRFAAGGGLIGLLVVIAAVALLVRGRYPRGIFDLVLGLHRWVVRVAAYAGLMTDEYPPFRLDAGGTEPGALGIGAAVPAGEAAEPERWSAWRVVTVTLGGITLLASLGALAAGTAAVVIDQTQRDADGFVTSGAELLSTPGFALVSDALEGDAQAGDWLLGTVRISATGARPLFVGIGPAADVERYLAGVRHAVVGDVGLPGGTDYDDRPGAAPAAPPGDERFWVAAASGPGMQVLDWQVEDGRWTAVAMNADGSAGVDARVRVGAELDHLLGLGIGALALGGLALALGVGLIFAAVPKRRR